MPDIPALPRDDLEARLIQVLIEARRQAGLRQLDVAQRLGQPQSFVSRYETHQRTLSAAEYVMVGRAIGVDPLVLMASALEQAQR